MILLRVKVSYIITNFDSQYDFPFLLGPILRTIGVVFIIK